MAITGLSVFESHLQATGQRAFRGHNYGVHRTIGFRVSEIFFQVSISSGQIFPFFFQSLVTLGYISLGQIFVIFLAKSPKTKASVRVPSSGDQKCPEVLVKFFWQSLDQKFLQVRFGYVWLGLWLCFRLG